MNIDFDAYRYYLIIDLEATCCDKQTIPRNEMETIEIGAVLVSANDLSIVDEFSTFVKPQRHPTLTAFCKELTSIDQSDVDASPSCPDALTLFKQWLYQYDAFVFCSWGDYDKHQLEQDSKFHGVPYPIASRHVNIKRLFSHNQGLRKKYGMAGALKLAGLNLEGVHHRGIDDARNMAKLMPYILGRKQVPKSNMISRQNDGKNKRA